MDVEEMIRSNPIDGVVLLAGACARTLLTCLFRWRTRYLRWRIKLFVVCYYQYIVSFTLQGAIKRTLARLWERHQPGYEKYICECRVPATTRILECFVYYAFLVCVRAPQVPTILVSGGPMLNGKFKGRDIGSGTAVWKMSEDVRGGRMSSKEFYEAESCMSRSKGHCMT